MVIGFIVIIIPYFWAELGVGIFFKVVGQEINLYIYDMRILKWIVDRVKGKVEAKSNSFGLVPYFEDIVWNGLEFDNEKFSSLIEVPKTEGLKEINEVKEHFDRFGDFIPNELESQRIELEQRLNKEL